MLTIIGGTYREICISPEWDQLFGSGLRAAVACAQFAEARHGQIKLCTWVAASESYELQCRADTYGVTVDVRHRRDAIEFRYEHPLSRPLVYPPSTAIEPIGRDSIICDTALVFGLLEGDVSVSAKRLVYDPQAGLQAVPLSKTGLRSKECCIVANLSEARAMLTGLGVGESISLSTAEVAKQLLAREKVVAVVVKNGIHGACVASGDAVQLCPCFKTNEVFPIGSGDVFSATFAFFWAVAGQEPATAAEDASRATAYYCNSRSLPIPYDLAAATNAFTPVATSGGRTAKLVYLAGPLFNVPDRWFVEETKRSLEECGLRVFSPLHEVGYSDDANQLATEDLKGLDRSDLVLALLDGLDVGTIFEVGYARAKGKPVVAYGERVADSDLAMLLGTGTMFFRDYASAVYHAAWAAASL